MCARQERGLAIAACCPIKKKGSIYIVPSQSGLKNYVVSPDPQNPHCTCPDFETRGETCKHLFAVQYVITREQHADGTETVTESVTITTKTKRPTYAQAWKEYNAAQVNEKDHFQALLRSLCDQIKEPVGQPVMGRPRIPMSDCVFMSAFKVYSTVSQRRFMCDLDDAREMGYLEKTPHFNAISRSLESEEMTPILERLIVAAAMPLREVETDFAIDSSGFMSTKFVRWFDHKYGKPREEHTWVKAHIICGVKTNVVTSVEIHERHTNDSPILPSLLKKTAKNFDVKELSGDAQYASVSNMEVIAANGTDPFIQFRSGINGAAGGVFGKAFHFFSLYREDFLQSYHKRSNVESTFSMIKRKFGDSVRSKTEVAMRNEVLCKFLAHNICCLISAFYELGIDPKLASIA